MLSDLDISPDDTKLLAKKRDDKTIGGTFITRWTEKITLPSQIWQRKLEFRLTPEAILRQLDKRYHSTWQWYKNRKTSKRSSGDYVCLLLTSGFKLLVDQWIWPASFFTSKVFVCLWHWCQILYRQGFLSPKLHIISHLLMHYIPSPFSTELSYTGPATTECQNAIY